MVLNTFWTDWSYRRRIRFQGHRNVKLDEGCIHVS
jgi:hypothetical protein